MKVCLISKYPPIEGFVSSYTYWLARGLGRRGIDVHVITNASEVEKTYKEKIGTEDIQYSPRNVVIHETRFDKEQGHIPLSKLYVEKMASLGIEAIRKNDLDIIDSRYLVPYTVSGFICKTVTGVPHVLRHAGSDIQRILRSPYLNTLCIEMLRQADKIVSAQFFLPYLNNMGIPNDKIALIHEVVDPTAFSPQVKPFDISEHLRQIHHNKPVITYVGKAFRNKGLFKLVEALRRIRKSNYVLLIVSQGGHIDQLREVIKRTKLQERTVFLGFVPPWRMPSIYKASTAVITAECNCPILHIPMIPREAIAVGKCVILSKEVHRLGLYPILRDNYSMLEVNPKDITNFAEKIKKIISNPDYAEKIGKNALNMFRRNENFEDYIDKTISLYKSLL